MNKIILFAFLICVCLISCSRGESAAEHNMLGKYYNEVSGGFKKALHQWDRAIEIDPQYTESYINRGEAYFANGLFDLAFADFDKAIEINPNDGLTYFSRGVCLMEMGEIQRATSDLERAMELGLPPAELETARELLTDISQ